MLEPYQIMAEAVASLLKVHYRIARSWQWNQNMDYDYEFEEASDEAKEFLKQELSKDIRVWMDMDWIVPKKKQYQFHYEPDWFFYPSGLDTFFESNNLARFFEKLPPLPKGKHYVFPYEKRHGAIYFGFEVDEDLSSQLGCRVIRGTGCSVQIQMAAKRLLNSPKDE